jgi:C-terminal processing protease CtpA/Prc
LKRLAIVLAFSATTFAANAEPAKPWNELQDIAEATAFLERKCPTRTEAMLTQAVKDVEALPGAQPPAPFVWSNQYNALTRIADAMHCAEQHGVASADVRDTAISGLIKGLGDENTLWDPPKKYAELRNRQPSFAIGVEASKDDGAPAIIQEVLPGGPAEAAGIKPLDELIAVNDESVPP